MKEEEKKKETKKAKEVETKKVDVKKVDTNKIENKKVDTKKAETKKVKKVEVKPAKKTDVVKESKKVDTKTKEEKLEKKDNNAVIIVLIVAIFVILIAGIYFISQFNEKSNNNTNNLVAYNNGYIYFAELVKNEDGKYMSEIFKRKETGGNAEKIYELEGIPYGIIIVDDKLCVEMVGDIAYKYELIDLKNNTNMDIFADTELSEEIIVKMKYYRGNYYFLTVNFKYFGEGANDYYVEYDMHKMDKDRKSEKIITGISEVRYNIDGNDIFYFSYPEVKKADLNGKNQTVIKKVDESIKTVLAYENRLFEVYETEMIIKDLKSDKEVKVDISDFIMIDIVFSKEEFYIVTKEQEIYKMSYDGEKREVIYDGEKIIYALTKVDDSLYFEAYADTQSKQSSLEKLKLSDNSIEIVAESRIQEQLQVESKEEVLEVE